MEKKKTAIISNRYTLGTLALIQVSAHRWVVVDTTVHGETPMTNKVPHLRVLTEPLSEAEAKRFIREYPQTSLEHWRDEPVTLAERRGPDFEPVAAAGGGGR